MIGYGGLKIGRFIKSRKGPAGESDTATPILKI